MFGGKLNSAYLGSFGDASILSFGYDKILSYKGGTLLVKSNLIYKRCKFYLTKNKNLNIEKEKNIFLNKLKNLDNEIAKKKLQIYKYKLFNKLFIKPVYSNEDVYWRYPLIFKGNREN